MSANPASRRKAERGGRRAEWLAAALLMLKGYAVIARRWKTPLGEIDLVARRGSLVAFVEVKARRHADDAIAAVTASSRRRIERASDLFLSRRPDLAACDVRYDIIAIAGFAPAHLKDAWRRGE